MMMVTGQQANQVTWFSLRVLVLVGVTAVLLRNTDSHTHSFNCHWHACAYLDNKDTWK